MRILILGATGMMGHEACRLFSERHEVFGGGRGDWSPEIEAGCGVAADRWLGGLEAGDIESIASALDRTRPDAVLNCVGIVKQLDEAKNAILSIEVNALFPHRLAQKCAKVGAKLVHMSTDCVFSGRRGGYTEQDNPDPVDLYGRSKLLGEVGELGALTVRTSIIGRQLKGQTGLVEWFVSQAGKKVKGFRGAIYTGLTTRALSGVIEEVLTKNASLEGVFQVASAPINKFDLLTRLNRQLDLGIEIEADDDFQCDRSLDGSRFEKCTGIKIPTWDTMIGAL